MHSRCFCAKLRTCAWANLMSSMSRPETFAIAASMSAGDRRKFAGDHLSNFSDSSRKAMSPRVSTSFKMPSTVARTLASLAATSLASRPRFRCLAIFLVLTSRWASRALSARDGCVLRLHSRLDFGQLVQVGWRVALLTVDARFVGGFHDFRRQRLDRLAGGWRAIESGLEAEFRQELRTEDLGHEGAGDLAVGERVAPVFKGVALAERDLVGRNPGQRILDVHRLQIPLLRQDLHHQLERVAGRRRGRAGGDTLGAVLLGLGIGERQADAVRVFAGHRDEAGSLVAKSLDGAEFAGLRPDAVNVRMRGERLGGLLLRRAVVPEGVVFRDDLDAGIFLEDVHRAVGVALVDGISGHAAAEKDLALAVERVHERLRRVLAEARGDVAHVIGARLGHGRVIHEEQDALLATLLDCPIEGARRDGEADDAVGLRVDHALVSGDLSLRIGAG